MTNVVNVGHGPVVPLSGIEGQTFKQTFDDKEPVVLVFFNGAWIPLYQPLWSHDQMRKIVLRALSDIPVGSSFETVHARLLSAFHIDDKGEADAAS